MPEVPAWVSRLADVIAALEQLPSPWVERVQLQDLLGVKPRRAQQILAPVAGRVVGRSYLADRLALIAHLRALAAGERTHYEQERRRQFAAQLAAWTAARQSQPQLLVEAPASVYRQTLAHLPSGVDLRPGAITVSFATPEEALQKLLQLAMAAGNQYEGFCDAVTVASDPGS